jgi:hypothetical protein
MPESPIKARINEGGAGVGGGGTKPLGGPGLMMVLDCKVTAPVSDNALPFGAAPVPSEMEAWARMLPLKMEVVPSVAEVPTCQKMLASCAPPCRMIWLPLKLVSALAIWKMKTLLVLP